MRLLATPHGCRICGSTATEIIASKVSSFSKMTFELAQCQQCSFRYVEPVVDPADIYDADYYAGRGADPLVEYQAEYSNWRDCIRVLEFENLLAIVASHFEAELHSHSDRFDGRPLRWLDYGCGAGGLLRFLGDKRRLQVRGRELEMEAWGSDTGGFAAKLKSAGEKIVTTDELAEVPEGMFDVVSCIEVIEHVLDPNAIMGNLARWLAPGGILLLTTGNLGSPLARVMGFRFPYCKPEIHISLFNPALLRRLYKSAGLVPMTVRMDGMLRFKMIKNLPQPLRQMPSVRWLATRRPVLVFFDGLFGVSRMPCAVKPQLPRG